MLPAPAQEHPLHTSFAPAMAALLPPDVSRIAVAVSGGADSMALALLAKHWVSAHHITLHALIVDHQLRPESAAEAQQVSGWLAAHSIENTILTVSIDSAANIEARAREARYDALIRWCKQHHTPHLLLGHHQNDQAETFLLSLARGSGVDGLCAMPAARVERGVHLLRPLLALPKSTLIEFLHSLHQPWVEDPSNTSDQFTRNRIRKAYGALAGEITAERISLATQNLARAREALEWATDQARAQCVTFYPEGYATLALSHFATLPEELALRMLAKTLHAISGIHTPHRLAQLIHAKNNLLNRESRIANPRFTFSGCVIEPDTQNANHVLILRELAACETLEWPQDATEIKWDNRFVLSAHAHFAETLTVRALAPEGWLQLPEDIRESSTIPKRIAYTLPALWHLDKLVAVPHLAYAVMPAKSLAVRLVLGMNGATKL